jgi:hypothetical protein
VEAFDRTRYHEKQSEDKAVACRVLRLLDVYEACDVFAGSLGTMMCKMDNVNSPRAMCDVGKC